MLGFIFNCFVFLHSSTYWEENVIKQGLAKRMDIAPIILQGIFNFFFLLPIVAQNMGQKMSNPTLIVYFLKPVVKLDSIVREGWMKICFGPFGLFYYYFFFFTK